MQLPLDYLVTPQSKDEIKQTLLDIAKQVGFPVTAWQSGGVADQILTIAATILAPFSSVISAIGSGGFFDLAAALKYPDGTDDPRWIRLLAKNVRVDYIPASFATGPVTLTNTSGTPVTYGAGELHVAHATSAKLYTNDASVTVPASGSANVNVVADEAGSTSTAGAGTITVLVTPVPGLSVSNAAAIVGSDDESNAALAQRCRDKLASLSPNGPPDAYRYFATSAKTASAITRAKVTSSGGVVTTTVANATGPVSGTVSPYPGTGDLGIVNVDIQTKCVPNGVTATVQSATGHNIKIVADVWYTGVLTQAQVQAAVIAYFTKLPIGGIDLGDGSGGMVYLEPIEGVIKDISSGVLRAKVSSPAAAVSMGSSEVAVCTSLLADFTLHQVI